MLGCEKCAGVLPGRQFLTLGDTQDNEKAEARLEKELWKRLWDRMRSKDTNSHRRNDRGSTELNERQMAAK